MKQVVGLESEDKKSSTANATEQVACLLGRIRGNASEKKEM